MKLAPPLVAGRGGLGDSDRGRGGANVVAGVIGALNVGAAVGGDAAIAGSGAKIDDDGTGIDEGAAKEGTDAAGAAGGDCNATNAAAMSAATMGTAHTVHLSRRIIVARPGTVIGRSC
jgi:hypothetical protein